MTELLEIPFRFENETNCPLSPYRKRIDSPMLHRRFFQILDIAEKQQQASPINHFWDTVKVEGNISLESKQQIRNVYVTYLFLSLSGALVKKKFIAAISLRVSTARSNCQIDKNHSYLGRRLCLSAASRYKRAGIIAVAAVLNAKRRLHDAENRNSIRVYTRARVRIGVVGVRAQTH